MQTSISISGNLSFGDQYRATCAFFARSRYSIFLYAFFIGFPLIGLAIVLRRGDEFSEPSIWDLPTWLVLSIGPLFAFVLLPLIHAAGVWQRRRKNVAIRGALTCTLSSEGFEMRGESFEMKLRWNAIHRAIETRDFFFLYIAAGAAHIIPKTWATSPSELEAMRTIIREALREKAKLRAQ